MDVKWHVSMLFEIYVLNTTWLASGYGCVSTVFKFSKRSFQIIVYVSLRLILKNVYNCKSLWTYKSILNHGAYYRHIVGRNDRALHVHAN